MCFYNLSSIHSPTQPFPFFYQTNSTQPSPACFAQPRLVHPSPAQAWYGPARPSPPQSSAAQSSPASQSLQLASQPARCQPSQARQASQPSPPGLSIQPASRQTASRFRKTVQQDPNIYLKLLRLTPCHRSQNGSFDDAGKTPTKLGFCCKTVTNHVQLRTWKIQKWCPATDPENSKMKLSYGPGKFKHRPATGTEYSKFPLPSPSQPSRPVIPASQTTCQATRPASSTCQPSSCQSACHHVVCGGGSSPDISKKRGWGEGDGVEWDELGWAWLGWLAGQGVELPGGNICRSMAAWDIFEIYIKIFIEYTLQYWKDLFGICSNVASRTIL